MQDPAGRKQPTDRGEGGGVDPTAEQKERRWMDGDVKKVEAGRVAALDGVLPLGPPV